MLSLSSSRIVAGALLPALCVIALAGCQEALTSTPEADVTSLHEPAPAGNHVSTTRSFMADPGVARALAEVRRATAPYHRLDRAKADKWDTDITGCMEDPELGGMGHHYANLELLDDQVELTRPEALLYEPHQGGMRLVAVEYIVPFTEWNEDDPPSLFGLSFHANHDFQVWALHAWIWKNNPSGMFANWNPRVSCP